MNKYISLLLRIFRECEFKKVIDFFYKEEKNKLESIKKFKHKSFFSECVKEKDGADCDVSECILSKKIDVLSVDCKSGSGLKLYGVDESAMHVSIPMPLNEEIS